MWEGMKQTGVHERGRPGGKEEAEQQYSSWSVQHYGKYIKENKNAIPHKRGFMIQWPEQTPRSLLLDPPAGRLEPPPLPRLWKL